VKIQANQIEVQRLVASFREDGVLSDGWVTIFIDESTGQRWRRTYLGSAYHGGGMPVLIREPMPTDAQLLELAAQSSDEAEIAACAWLLTELDREGAYKEPLLAIAEDAAGRNDQTRAALLVGWGNLLDEMNLRSPLRKPAAEVASDHEHFKRIAGRAQALLRRKNTDPAPRNPRVFGLNRERLASPAFAAVGGRCDHEPLRLTRVVSRTQCNPRI
jgi:hypothetical protein